MPQGLRFVCAKQNRRNGRKVKVRRENAVNTHSDWWRYIDRVGYLARATPNNIMIHHEIQLFSFSLSRQFISARETRRRRKKLFIEKNSNADVLKIQKPRVTETRICKFSSLRSKSPCVRVRLMFTLAGKCIIWQCCRDQVSKQEFMASNGEIWGWRR